MMHCGIGQAWERAHVHILVTWVWEEQGSSQKGRGHARRQKQQWTTTDPQASTRQLSISRLWCQSQRSPTLVALKCFHL